MSGLSRGNADWKGKHHGSWWIHGRSRSWAALADRRGVRAAPAVGQVGLRSLHQPAPASGNPRASRAASPPAPVEQPKPAAEEAAKPDAAKAAKKKKPPASRPAETAKKASNEAPPARPPLRRFPCRARFRCAAAFRLPPMPLLLRAGDGATRRRWRGRDRGRLLSGRSSHDATAFQGQGIARRKAVRRGRALARARSSRDRRISSSSPRRTSRSTAV